MPPPGRYLLYSVTRIRRSFWRASALCACGGKRGAEASHSEGAGGGRGLAAAGPPLRIGGGIARDARLAAEIEIQSLG